MSFDEFMAGEDRRLAVAHLVMLCGECVARLTPDLRDRHPQLPWTQVISVRNRLVHASFAVDWGIAFEIAQQHLPLLLDQVAKILARDYPEFEHHQ